MRTFILLLITASFLIACESRTSKNTINWQLPQAYYNTALQQAVDSLPALKQINSQSEALTHFQKIRLNFKKAESYAAHLNPEVGARVNGPALPVFREDNYKVLDAVGLQAIEETLFENFEDKELLNYQIDRTEGLLNNLLAGSKERKLTPDRYFIALHEQFLRILSFGITHFDTPVSHWGFKESAASLKSIKATVELTLGALEKSAIREEYANFSTYLDRNIDFLSKAEGFDNFNYYRYIRDYFNPLTESWVKLRNAAGIWDAPKNRPLNFNAVNFFQENTFNTSFFVNPSTGLGGKSELALGKKLFNDKRLSLSKNLSCASCHQENLAFTDNMKTSLGATGKPIKRNAPTLINSIFNQSFFWDGRSGSVESQIREVFNAHDEFNRAMNDVPKEVLSDPSYQAFFKEVYGGQPKSNNQFIKTLAQYVASLQSFDSKFDRNMRKEEQSFTEIEKKGMQLYLGKALCGSCHFVPLMNGTLPPFYRHTEKEVIGVPLQANNKVLDTVDLGFYPFFGVDIHKGMFRTPTVRNSSLTAPYMHNGVYATLEEVIDFYNKGGGEGLGLAVEHQTLPFDSLSLSQSEQAALIAFLKTLESGVKNPYTNSKDIMLSSIK